MDEIGMGFDYTDGQDGQDFGLGYADSGVNRTDSAATRRPGAMKEQAIARGWCVGV